MRNQYSFKCVCDLPAYLHHQSLFQVNKKFVFHRSLKWPHIQKIFYFTIHISKSRRDCIVFAGFYTQTPPKFTRLV
jgi:hypothetical protein